MIFLTSNGITSPLLHEAFKKAQTKYGNKTAFIPTAISSKNEKEEYLEGMVKELSALNCEVEVFELENRPVAELLNFDTIWLSGGNVFYLMDVLHSLNCKDLFARLAKEKLIVGVSAGSLILQDNLELIRELIPRMNRHVKLKDLKGLGLTGNIEHLPHKSRYLNTLDSFEKRVKTYETKTKRKVICLEDGQGIVLDSGSVEYLL